MIFYFSGYPTTKSGMPESYIKNGNIMLTFVRQCEYECRPVDKKDREFPPFPCEPRMKRMIRKRRETRDGR